MEFIQDAMPTLDEDAILIGHSSGCPLLLSILQRGSAHIKQAILVGGYYAPIDGVVSGKMIEHIEYDWKKIRSSVDSIVLINSDNDPWGCDNKQARPVADKLGAQFVLAQGEGHMGSGMYHQPYREHTLVKELLKV